MNPFKCLDDQKAGQCIQFDRDMRSYKHTAQGPPWLVANWQNVTGNKIQHPVALKCHPGLDPGSR